MTERIKLQVKALKMLLKDYEKLLQKARKKREKELNPLQGTEKLSKDDLAEMYGWGNITWEQYQAALETLGDSNDKVEVSSITSEYSGLKNRRFDMLKAVCDICKKEAKIPYPFSIPEGFVRVKLTFEDNKFGSTSISRKQENEFIICRDCAEKIGLLKDSRLTPKYNSTADQLYDIIAQIVEEVQ